jgi:hypothetical protein
MRRYLEALGDWIMDRVFNPKGYYDDGAPFRTFQELLDRPPRHS